MNRNRIWRLHMQSTGNSLEKALLFVCLVCLFLFECADIVQGAEKRMQNIPSDVQVIFIPGWQSEDEDYKEEIKTLTLLFPQYIVCPQAWHWDSNQYWPDAIRAADAEAKTLALLISNLPKKQQEELILVGHSLGGRIVIHTMATLNRDYKIKIKQGIFLGAAICDNDPQIEAAINASSSGNLNLYCREDAVLYRAFRDWGDGSKLALGAFGYSKPYSSFKLQEFPHPLSDQKSSTLEKFKKHEARNYIRFLEHILRESQYAEKKERLIIPGSAMIPMIQKCMPELDQHDNTADLFTGEEQDNCQGWTLRKKRVSFFRTEYFIFDPNNNFRQKGDEKTVQNSFKKIKDLAEKFSTQHIGKE